MQASCACIVKDRHARAYGAKAGMDASGKRNGAGRSGATGGQNNNLPGGRFEQSERRTEVLSSAGRRRRAGELGTGGRQAERNKKRACKGRAGGATGGDLFAACARNELQGSANKSPEGSGAGRAGSGERYR